jgi:4-hydroxy-tetrahydrodipicolinate synthase
MEDNNKFFTGVYTAIVTPFNDDHSIDYDNLKNLIEEHIDAGVAGIVPCGTTGESPTLTEKEQEKIIEFTVKEVNNRVKILAGTGSNSTIHAVEMTKFAESVGVDGALVVNPYYNKPTQEGLYRHFKAVANSVKIPIMVYNIFGRTGVNVETPTLLRLIDECDNIIAVKEASGNIEQMKDVIDQSPKDFCILSGDDGLTLDLIKEGGDGVVSVASNILPDEMVEMTRLALEGNMDEAVKLYDKLTPFFDVEFIETNPIPIKAALAIQGKIKESYRLPLCELMPENKEKLKKVMQDLELI